MGFFPCFFFVSCLSQDWFFELLCESQFVMADNKADIAAVKLGFPPPSRSNTAVDVGTLLQRCQLTNTRHIISRDGLFSEALLAQLRLLVADDEELRTVSARLTEGGTVAQEAASKFISWDNELNVSGLPGMDLRESRAC